MNEETPAPQEEEGAEPPKKSKKMLVIIIVIVLVVVLAVVGMVVMKKEDKPSKAKKAETKKKKEAIAYYHMNPIIVNLNSSASNPRFLKLKLTLEMQKKSDEKVLIERMPKIKDILQLYLRELKPSDLDGAVALYRIREEILTRINKSLYPLNISDLFFDDILVQ